MAAIGKAKLIKKKIKLADPLIPLDSRIKLADPLILVVMDLGRTSALLVGIISIQNMFLLEPIQKKENSRA